MPRRGGRQGEALGLVPWASPMIPALWYMPHMGGISAGIPAEATIFATPFWIGRDCKLDRIAVNVTIVGTAGAVIRLGIWEDNGSGYPGKLLLDAGTVVGDSGTGRKEITIAQPVKAGLYWVGICVQGGAGTRPQLGSFNTTFWPFVGDEGANPVMTGYHISYSQASVTGAFGSSFSATKVFSGAAFVTMLRASA